MVGGEGQDVLTGGSGHDTFVLRGVNDAGDIITDFTPGHDVLQLDGAAFGLDLGSAKLGENFSVIGQHFDGSNAGTNAAFSAGSSALIYSAADHALYYDSNGAAEGYTVVATIQPGAILAATDIRLTDSAAV